MNEKSPVVALVEPLSVQDCPDLADIFDHDRQRYGFVPSSHLVLARNPQFFRAFAELSDAGLWSGKLAQEDRLLIGAVASAEAGSAYCLAHLGVAMTRGGGRVPPAVLQAALTQLDTTPLLSEAQRVSLQIARDIAAIPNRVRPHHFDRLREHYNEDEIIEIVFVACHFGFLARFNSMLGPVLEPIPLEWALNNLAGPGWHPESRDPRAASAYADALALQLPKPPIPDGGGARLEPLRPEDVPGLVEEFAWFQQSGFVPNSILIMARRPDLVTRMREVLVHLTQSRSVPADLAYMASWVSSYATGCQYCQAHTSFHADTHGADVRKIENLWAFDTSPLFSPTERSALRVALAGASQPSAMTRQLDDEMREHFDSRQIVDLMIAISNFGFFNRWNDTFETPLEDAPVAFASAHLGDAGWDGGRHVRQ